MRIRISLIIITFILITSSCNPIMEAVSPPTPTLTPKLTSTPTLTPIPTPRPTRTPNYREFSEEQCDGYACFSTYDISTIPILIQLLGDEGGILALSPFDDLEKGAHSPSRDNGMWSMTDNYGNTTMISRDGEKDKMDVTIIERKDGAKNKVYSTKGALISIALEISEEEDIFTFHYIPSSNQAVMPHEPSIKEDHPATAFIFINSEGKISTYTPHIESNENLWCLGGPEYKVLGEEPIYGWTDSCPTIYVEKIIQ